LSRVGDSVVVADNNSLGGGGSGEGYPGVSVALRRGNASHSLHVADRSSSGIAYRKRVVHTSARFLAVLTVRYATHLNPLSTK